MRNFELELNGPNVIAESERSGKARSLFWPWAGANVSLLALSYGSFFLGFGISFRQATCAAIIGTVLSFLVVGISSLAGKRSNAPTMILSRAAFGVKGNIVPGALSYLIFVGWETVLVSLATLATGTVFMRVGNIDYNLALIIGFVVAVSLTVFGGVLGFSTIMRLQKWLTLITIFMTIIYIALTVDTVNWSAVTAIEDGSTQAFIGALIFGITGIGLGWVNAAADYSRYLPRSVSSRAVVGWTVLGASIVPIILVIYGSALAGSSKELSDAIAMDPIGALTTLLPTWFLIPFALVAILGLVGGAILDLYSSGLTLVSIGLPVKRHVAASIDAVIMLAGTIYIVWFAENFFFPFQGFLITLGVPVAVWSAIFVADVLLRKNSYSEVDLFNERGLYGAWNRQSLSLMVVGSIVGWGFVTNSFASWLDWQGYFLGAIGGKDGPWAYANVGVIFALVFGFVGHILLSRRKIRAQENALS
ncbi:MAG: nucleobase:cation symporter-1, NCS1 family [Actinobacteria bacterium]|nr:nucleobase:cation symporter-1, NCS1 family [Actinomycetota bacterium]